MRARTFLLFAIAVLAGCGGRVDHQGSGPERTAAIDWAELLPNARQTFEGVLAGGQPSPDQLEAARAAGFRTVINLRVPGERDTHGEPERVEALGMSYVSIPVQGADGLTEENARRLARALEEAEYPVIVHCGSGNRVAGLFALKAFYLDGKSAEQALAIGAQAGLTRLEPAVEERLAAAARGARLNLTQLELGQRVGVRRQTILAIEKQRYVPSALLAFKIARVLGMRVDELFELDDNPS